MKRNILERALTSVGQAAGSLVAGFREKARGQKRRRPRFFGAWAQQGRYGSYENEYTSEYAQRRAAGNSWYYAGVQHIQREFISAEFEVQVQRDVDTDAISVPNHPLERLLVRPNPLMGTSYFWQYTLWWLYLKGEAHWFVLCDTDHTGKWKWARCKRCGTRHLKEYEKCPCCKAGPYSQHRYAEPIELWPLPSQYVEPVPGDDERFIDHYEYTVNGTRYNIPAEYIVCFKFPNPYDIFRGLSPLVAGMLPVDTDIYQAIWNMNFFGNDRAMPDSIINLANADGEPVDEDVADSLIADLRNDFQVHRRRTAITSVFKLEVQRLIESHQEMEFIQAREFNRDEILNIIGLHPAIFDPNATEANAKVAERIAKATVHSVHVLLAQEITAQLLWPYYGKHYKAHFEDIRQTDRQLMFSEMDRAKGALTVEEYRARYYNAEPLGDERDNVLYGETAVQPVELGGELFEFTPELEAAAVADLDKWKDKAIRSFKRKRGANVDFESEFISATVLGHIALRLASVDTIEDIKAVFEEGAALLPFSSIKIVGRPIRPWSTMENQLEAAVLDVFAAESEKFTQAIAVAGPEALQDEALWVEQQENLSTVLTETVLAILFLSIDSARSRMPAEVAATIQWDMVRGQARAYAQSYSLERATQLTQTTRKRLQKALADWIEREGDLEELIDDVDAVIDDRKRATGIAVTESTDAFSYGQAYAFVQAGYGAPGMRPPLHPRCRCDTETYVLPDGTKVIVWITKDDEKVCINHFQTPIGEVVGCRDMYTRVISVGPYFGLKLSDAIRKAKRA